MNDIYITKLSKELKLSEKSIRAAINLLDDGATIPFIARYRKEATGSLDEIAIVAIRDRLKQLREIDKRRETILKSVGDQGKLTDELKEKILRAETLAILEDIYLPFKPKRRTRATIAKEKGLEPLAKRLFEQDPQMDPIKAAEEFIDSEKKVKTPEDALSGARDIIAEWVNEDTLARDKMRSLFETKAVFKSKVIRGKEKEGVKYKDYYDWQESVKKAPSHRILAMRRGEKEGFLVLRVLPPEEDVLLILEEIFVKGEGKASEQVKMATHDSYKRLLSLSMEREIRLFTKERADKEAIYVFVDNFRQLLMAPPLGQKNVLAIDPGFRTGCKVVCLDSQGKLLNNITIYPTTSGVQVFEAEKKVIELCKIFPIEVIAIGNGTASRETENFIRSLKLPRKISVVVVNESGASVYSVSKVAQEEFPDYDVTVRGAVSIGRRLMDPLAELVKIDPKSIGVGQYQHDVDQNLLKASLDDVVISCVNAVGVELNTASKELFTYVSGVGSGLGKAIVDYRDEHGPFSHREELKNVPGLGLKVFEQAAGFLRIRQGDNPLDASAVHPESYAIVDQMTTDLNCTIQDLIAREKLRRRIDLNKYVTDKTGLPTLNDIRNELAKPGRDPRSSFELFEFAEGITKPEDLSPGMKLPGIVTNVTDFGVFVDIGVHLEGLVHISQISDKFIKHPKDAVKLHQKVMVTVLLVDLERQRVSLSMKESSPEEKTRNTSPFANL